MFREEGRNSSSIKRDSDEISGDNFKKLRCDFFKILQHFALHLQEKWDKKIYFCPLNVNWSKMILHSVCYHRYKHKKVTRIWVENLVEIIVAPTVVELWPTFYFWTIRENLII